MSNKSGVFRLFVSATLCLLIIIYGVLNILLPSSKSNIKSQKETNLLSLSVPANGYIGTSQSTIITTPQNTENSKTEPSAEQSKPAASSGKVLGKIIEKFITPYTANTSYGNVYLKNSTGLDISIKELLQSPLGFKIEKNDQPQVLILHTHTTESFMLEERDYYTDTDTARRTDTSLNNALLGKIVSDKLNSVGITTVHDTTLHDYPEYNGSYERAAKTIKSYLKKYPSIKVVIDMHRDAISSGDSDKVKPVTEIGGKKAAQVMLVMGSESGSVTNFPNWKENLKLGVRLQKILEDRYPTLARSLYFCSRRYNENLTTGSMIIEIGTDANTIDEVSYSAQLVSEALCELLG